MATESLSRVIDADGHVMEDITALVSYMPPEYSVARAGRTPFPPLDHQHSANQHKVPDGSFAPIREEGWLEFSAVAGVAVGNELPVQPGKSRTATVTVTPAPFSSASCRAGTGLWIRSTMMPTPPRRS